MIRFWVQTKAPAGNWTDCIGTGDLEGALRSARWQAETFKHDARVVERTDNELQQFNVESGN